MSQMFVFNTDEQVVAILQNQDGSTACPFWESTILEQLNGQFTFDFQVPAKHRDAIHLVEGNKIGLWADDDFLLFEITQPDDQHEESLIKTIVCEHVAIVELNEDIVRDKRPSNVTADVALDGILTDTVLGGSKWKKGTVAALGTATPENIYYESVMNGIQKIRAAYKTDYKPRIVPNGKKLDRFIDLGPRGSDTGRRFEYTKDIKSIKRSVDMTGVKTALVGRGKGEESGDGYGRRIDFSTVEWTKAAGKPTYKPLLQDWIGDPDALAKFGQKGDPTINGIPNGGIYTGEFNGNTSYNGNVNVGEIQVKAGTFIHPNGTRYVIDDDTELSTSLEGSKTGEFYIMFIGSDPGRFSFTFTTNSRHFVLAKYSGSSWTWDNNTADIAFTPTQGDCIVAKVIGGTGGVVDISMTKRHRVGTFEAPDTDDPAVLIQQTWDYLQTINKPRITYSMTVLDLAALTGLDHQKIHMGDTVTVIDREFQPAIVVKARVIEIKRVVGEPEKTEIKLGNFIPMFTDELSKIDEVEQRLNDNSGRWNDATQPITSGDYPDATMVAPTGVKATGLFKAITVEWAFSNDINIAQYEVYGSKTNNFTPDTANGSNLLFRGLTAAFVHNAAINETWYYRVRAVNRRGTGGPFAAQVTAATLRINANDITPAVITNSLIAANADIDGAKIAQATITNAHITGTLDANKIKVGTGTVFTNGYDPTKITVGGRNMIQKTDIKNDWKASYWDAWNSNTLDPATKQSIALTSGETIDFLVVRSVSGLANNSTFGYATGNLTDPDTQKMTLIAGKEYTVSFLVACHANSFNDLRYTYIINDGGSNQTLTVGNVTTSEVYGTFASGFLLTVYKHSFTFTAQYTSKSARLLIGNRTAADFTGGGSYGLFYIANLKLEEGNKATTWMVAPEDTEGKINIIGTFIDPTGLYTGKISFNQGEGGSIKLGAAYGDGELHVYDSGGTAIGRVVQEGAYFPQIQADAIVGNVLNTYKPYVNDLFYFDVTSGNDANSGLTSVLPKKSLQAFLNALPKDLNGSTITFRCKGTLTEVLALNGFRNGKIQIIEYDASNKMIVKNGVWAYYCEKIFLQSLDIHGFGGNGNAMVHAFDCKDFHCYDVKLYAGANQSHGFWMINTGFRFDGCHVYNITDRGLFASLNSRGYVQNCKGNPPVAILSDLGATVSGFGTRWNGSLVGRDGGEVWGSGSWTIDFGEAAPPTPPPATEQVLTLTPGTGDNWSTSGYWTNDEVKQGDWGYGTRYGLWYVDLNAIKGKTIVSASITVYRGSGGASAGRTVHFRAHNYLSRAGRPAGAPTMSGAYAKGTIAVGETKTFDITDLVSAQIAAGSYRSIGCYITGGTDYMSLGTTPTISIRYK